ncbi:UbiX family flavin prenyltransferase [Psychromonas sp. RZ22]|uniref:flavin prenyltransferase UbiX n=1 Tax=Psychromonas algarum TaxID=2555643 RepID=UPI0010672828|nr:flavin prenyltransferase UbiX [Psychromonas sp. RZ22]TEW56945.1 UbiX family flavin prenyltransferase [Psychromonas sp. RZ22]
MSYNETVTLGVTGASGSGYFLRLLQTMVNANVKVYLILSEAAQIVLKTEADENWPTDIELLNEFLAQRFNSKKGQIIALASKDWFSPVASGSSAPHKMVICPCSCGTLASISQGLSNNLIERAVDVVFKERGQLIVMPRETPLSTLHLKNMLTLSELGATVMPLAPGFYHQPKSIEELHDFMVARVMDHLKIQHGASKRWCE